MATDDDSRILAGKLFQTVGDETRNARAAVFVLALVSGGDLVYIQTEYDVISYFRSAFLKFEKNDRKWRLMRLCVEYISITAFCLPRQFLVFWLSYFADSLARTSNRCPSGPTGAVLESISGLQQRFRPSDPDTMMTNSAQESKRFVERQNPHESTVSSMFDERSYCSYRPSGLLWFRNFLT